MNSLLEGDLESSLEKKNRLFPSTSTRESQGFSLINDDILQNILSRLPATAFASAACVSKAWNAACTRFLSRPKLSSAISLNPFPLVALQEVFDKVMSEPIRPHFAIASVGPRFSFSEVLQYMVKKLGSTTPIILSSVSGIMGQDAHTHDFREVMWSDDDDDNSINTGILLTVGFVPGLKVEAIPLFRLNKTPLNSADNKFVMDIKSYTSSVSGGASPPAIIMIGGTKVDVKPVMEKLDYAMPKETIIVGNVTARFVYRSADISRNVIGSPRYSPAAVALVFARDRHKAHGIGDVEFHFALSDGISAVGPRYKAASVLERNSEGSTWLTARREGQQQILDGQHMMDDVSNEMENNPAHIDLYIGVTKRRNCSVGSEKPRLMTSLALHGIIGDDEEYLYVDGVGIRTGDCFQFYLSDTKIALQSSRNVSSTLRNLKLGWDSESCLNTRVVTERKEAFGSLIFSCCGRGEPFFGQPNVDSLPFLENFPGVPVAGIFCGGEIGRCHTSLTAHAHDSARCHLHIYSTVYLVMSYTAPAEF